MGTRSLTHVYNDDGQILTTVYRQFDGYPEGHGKDLAEFLSPFVLVNGIPLGDPRKLANGMGCLAAQLIAHLKEGADGIYLNVPGSRNGGEEFVYDGEEFVYEIRPDGESFRVTVIRTGWKNSYVPANREDSVLFGGTVPQLLEFVNAPRPC